MQITEHLISHGASQPVFFIFLKYSPLVFLIGFVSINPVVCISSDHIKRVDFKVTESESGLFEHVAYIGALLFRLDSIRLFHKVQQFL